MEKISKLLVNFNEGTKDYVTATVYNMMDEETQKLPNIRKPENVSDYTTSWKQGLYTHYENVARECLQAESMQFIHL